MDCSVRPPPNSAALFKLRRAGRVPVPGPFGHVCILPEWDMETPGFYLTVPSELDPGELDFSCVAGLEVSIFWPIGTLGHPLGLDDLLGAVMAGEPASIAVINLLATGKTLAGAMYCTFTRVPAHD
jgi:hypothetical protein